MALPLAGLIVGFLERLRFPTLFKITLVLAAISWLWPFDPIPFVDEIVTGLGLLLLARIKRRDEEKPASEVEASGGHR
ncbi:MAG: hypothetical protein KDJ14_09980 [Xanthomonadales bacterium]|nr:hypothetical protein [Xanthomonadales bacterium]